MENPSKKSLFEKNSKYFTISTYTIFVIFVACIIIRLVYHWDITVGYLGNLFSKMSSFLFGILIAFMVNPLVHYMQKNVLEKRCKIKKKNLSQSLSILISYVIVLGFLIICLVYVIPQLISSISDLSAALPGMYRSFSSWLIQFAYSKEFLSNDLVNKFISKLSPKIVEFSTTLVSKIVPWLYSASVSLIRWFVSFFIAVIVSIYLLIDKKIIFNSIKKFMYAFLPENVVRHSIAISKNCYRIFSGYIVAKAIDSLIIGLLCFVIMVIFHLPYSVLVSVIVGITNMIPYFGPYIGAVPSVLMLSVIKLKYGVIFLILIVILQQFDGLYLGPKLLGNSTGVRPILILLAITLGGAYAGVLGMFLGVPFIAVIQYLLGLLIDKRLKAQNIEIDDIS